MKIERDKIYVARNGEKFRVVCVDAPGLPIIGVPLEENSDAACRWWSEDGSYCGFRAEQEFDLIREAREPREFYVSVERDGAIRHGAQLKPGEHPPSLFTHVREVLGDE